jgi:integrase/recombinase XerC
MPKALQLFEQYLITEKRYSVHTIRAYMDDLAQCQTFLKINFDIDEVQFGKSPFFRTWLSLLKEQGQTAKTINRKISSLKTFFKFLMKIEMLEQSPLTNITAPKIAKRLPQYVASQDIGHLLFQMPFPETYNGILEKTILFTFYYTGMRLSELQFLKHSAVNLHNKSIKVLGKGNKERIIPISDELQQQLNIYITNRKNVEPIEQDILFVSEKGKPLYAKLIYTIVNTHLRSVTTIDKKSPHILRHSIATHLTNNGAELNAVKELLGHASLAATQIYTHNSIEKLKNAYNKAHPKA